MADKLTDDELADALERITRDLEAPDVGWLADAMTVHQAAARLRAHAEDLEAAWRAGWNGRDWEVRHLGASFKDSLGIEERMRRDLARIAGNTIASSERSAMTTPDAKTLAAAIRERRERAEMWQLIQDCAVSETEAEWWIEAAIRAADALDALAKERDELAAQLRGVREA